MDGQEITSGPMDTMGFIKSILIKSSSPYLQGSGILISKSVEIS